MSFLQRRAARPRYWYPVACVLTLGTVLWILTRSSSHGPPPHHRHDHWEDEPIEARSGIPRIQIGNYLLDGARYNVGINEQVEFFGGARRTCSITRGLAFRCFRLIQTYTAL